MLNQKKSEKLAIEYSKTETALQQERNALLQLEEKRRKIKEDDLLSAASRQALVAVNRKIDDQHALIEALEENQQKYSKNISEARKEEKTEFCHAFADSADAASDIASKFVSENYPDKIIMCVAYDLEASEFVNAANDFARFIGINRKIKHPMERLVPSGTSWGHLHQRATIIPDLVLAIRTTGIPHPLKSQAISQKILNSAREKVLDMFDSKGLLIEAPAPLYSPMSDDEIENLRLQILNQGAGNLQDLIKKQNDQRKRDALHEQYSGIAQRFFRIKNFTTTNNNCEAA